MSYNYQMKKSISLLGFILILTIACNFPFGNKQNNTDLISTQVASARTATQSALSQLMPSPTTTETFENPTITVVPPTATLTPEPTNTPAPQDFTSQLGSPAYSNPMNSGKSFGIDASGYDDGYTRITLSDGAMVMSSYAANGWRGWRLTDRGMSNFYLEGTFNPQSCAGRDQYGLVFRSPDYSTGEGFYYGVSCEGKYSLVLSDGSRYQTLIEATSSNEINPGSNQTNRLGVLAEGSKLTLYINGKKVDETTNPSYQDATKVGVFIQALNTPGFIFKLDQFDMWQR